MAPKLVAVNKYGRGNGTEGSSPKGIMKGTKATKGTKGTKGMGKLGKGLSKKGTKGMGQLGRSSTEGTKGSGSQGSGAKGTEGSRGTEGSKGSSTKGTEGSSTKGTEGTKGSGSKGSQWQVILANGDDGPFSAWAPFAVTLPRGNLTQMTEIRELLVDEVGENAWIFFIENQLVPHMHFALVDLGVEHGDTIECGVGDPGVRELSMYTTTQKPHSQGEAAGSSKSPEVTHADLDRGVYNCCTVPQVYNTATNNISMCDLRTLAVPWSPSLEVPFWVVVYILSSREDL
jgi:hypothetical protein